MIDSNSILIKECKGHVFGKAAKAGKVDTIIIDNSNKIVDLSIIIDTSNSDNIIIAKI